MLLEGNGPFAANGHMIQNPPCWRTSYALDIQNKENSRLCRLSRLVLDVTVRNLLSSMADSVPCDHWLQRAHYAFEMGLARE